MNVWGCVRAPFATIGWLVDVALRMREQNRLYADALAKAEPKQERQAAERELCRVNTCSLRTVPHSHGARGVTFTAEFDTDSGLAALLRHHGVPIGFGSTSTDSVGVAAPTGTPGQSSGTARSGSTGPQQDSVVAAASAAVVSPSIPPGGGTSSPAPNLPPETGAGEHTNELAALIAEVLDAHEGHFRREGRYSSDRAAFECLEYSAGGGFQRVVVGDDYQDWLRHVAPLIAERVEKSRPPAPFTFGDLVWAAGVIKAYAAVALTDEDAYERPGLLALADRLADAGHADPTP